MSDENTNSTSMGDLFRERRAMAKERQERELKQNNQKQKQESTPEPNVTILKQSSFLEIQQQQEEEERKNRLNSKPSSNQTHGRGRVQEYDRMDKETRNISNNKSLEGRGGGRLSENQRDGGSFRRGGFHHRGAALPREEGEIVSLFDKYGFIRCAQRDADVFFHYTEVKGNDPSSLECGDEVEFDIGQSSSTSSKPQKLAAFNVTALTKGTVKWEIPDNSEGLRIRGKVEKTPRSGNGNANVSAQFDGIIRINTSEESSESEEEKTKSSTDKSADKLSEGLIWYNSDDISKEKNDSSKLAKGDLIEFSTAQERRTGRKIAKDIILIQSERERLRLLREQKMLDEATLERGVVTSLNSDGGYLRSTSRLGPIYFQYANVELPEKNETNSDSNECTLAEGQDMEFLVCKEEANGRNKSNRLIALKIKFLPKNTVKFHHHIATAVVGVLTLVPAPSRNRQAHQKGFTRGGIPGKVRLLSTIVLESGEKISEVLIDAEDTPGGVFAANRDGSQFGVWIREGDQILFDVIQEIFDGSYYAKGTPCLLPNEEHDKNGKTSDDLKKSEEIRLIQPSLAGRTQGTISALKEGYGFIACAERNIDVYFRTYELFPTSLQMDIIRHMTRGEKGKGSKERKKDKISEPKLSVGTQVTFDISLATFDNNRRGKQHENDNMKGQRVCILPKGSFMIDVLIVEEVKAVVTQEHKDKSGFVELETPITAMSRDDRHPLVAELLNSIFATGETVVYQAAQSSNEIQIITSMAEQRGLEVSIVGGTGNASSSDALINGDTKLQISKSKGSYAVNDRKIKDQELTPEAVDTDKSNTTKNSGKKKSARKSKPVKTIRFEKNSVARDNKGGHPGLGDVVTCNVSQSRRTGAYLATAVKVIERKLVERKSSDADISILKPVGVPGTGIVTEIVSARDFGFITQLDEHGSKQEVLFFHMSSVMMQNNDETRGDETQGKSGKRWKGKHNDRGSIAIKKGDEVKFEIGKNEKNGKRVALNIVVLPHGALQISSKTDKNSCEGIILMEPAHTSLSHTPAHGTTMNNTPLKSGSRWADVPDTKGKKESGSHMTEEGLVLLISDNYGQFINEMRMMQSSKAGQVYSKTSEPSINQNEDVPLIDDKANESKKEKSTKETHSCFFPIHVKYRSSGTGAFSSVAPFRRGDLISFVKGRGHSNTAKDIRLITRSYATTRRGYLENVSIDDGTAIFVTKDDEKTRYSLDLSETISCDIKLLKEHTEVEGILYDNKIYGVCRTTDLYLSSKVKIGTNERPRLNLTVKKELRDLGGKIVAQSGLAKGPDGTKGFSPGWTKRVSAFGVVMEEADGNNGENTVEKHGETESKDALGV